MFLVKIGGKYIMFNKKLLLGALAVLGTTAALIGCSTEPEFEQNTSSYEVPE